MSDHSRYDVMDGLIQLQRLRSVSSLACDAIARMPVDSVAEYEDIVSRICEFSPEDKEQERLDLIRSRYMEQEVLERIEAQSALSSAYAAFEFTLTMMAETVLRSSGLGLSLSDFHGKGIERAKVVLRKVGGVSSVFETPSWKKIKDYSELRNKIMHGGGLVGRGSEEAKKLAAIEYVELVDFGEGHDFMQVSLPAFLVRQAFAEFEAFLEALYEELEGKRKC
ncbi:MAG: hypothetical protein KBT70_08585 [Roseovarius sp.]|uniref:hypothetical protein n=1 Tax=Roseovarius sp. TaxID=1486281 RepID=UPI001B4117DF|nr:hypothetical protein [Roseovarius sp.]MBQ0750244.1 hypothetical protein [Roseovarius sp.]MBQ0811184.1 hypothetical protein [Roseovarius sp.]